MTRSTLIPIPIQNTVREIELSGKKLRGALSPMDFPERLRFTLIEDEPRRAVLEFLYSFDQHEVSEQRNIGQLQVTLGRHSGRVLKVEIPLSALAESPEFRGGMALEQLLAVPHGSESRSARRVAHYSMMRELLPATMPAIEAKLKALREEQRRGI